jgi:antitoxin ParD1/3/4
MPMQIILSPPQEKLVKRQLEGGRHSSAEAVVAEALGMLATREAQLAAMDEAIALGLEDVAAGRTASLDAVCDRLEAKYAAPAAA